MQQEITIQGHTVTTSPMQGPEWSAWHFRLEIDGVSRAVLSYDSYEGGYTCREIRKKGSLVEIAAHFLPPAPPTTKKKAWTEDQIVALLEKNPKAVYRAIVRLYRNTTKNTGVQDGIGVNRYDKARIERYNDTLHARGTLIGGALDGARRLVLKYRKQLLAIANA